ncbi:major facilitator superfamily domain-containing protein [Aspergillus pseudodeflectus]|uniref:Major facilitator superfamily domain-containing protein n=1 Tax=Aspergillus pseudodeflectus TaxID=176178 RepID=A0ABR4JFA9_9EURO
MGLGVLEDRSGLHRVPGTVTLAEIEQSSGTTAIGRLKRGTGKDKDIILIPQPSNDPNDPLNWPQPKKITIVAIMVLGACLNAGAVGTMLNASFVILSAELNKSLSDTALLAGYTMVAAGAACPLASAFATKYGKRPVLLASSAACLIGSIIGSVGQNYDTLLAARIIQGFGLAAYESLTFLVVADLFYIHQRGPWVNMIAFSYTSVSNLSSVIAGPITFNLGWRYLFHILVALSGLQTLLVLFFCPETSYIRDPFFNRHLATTGSGEVDDAKISAVVEEIESLPANPSSPPPPNTFWQQMAIYTAVYSDENLLKLIFGPFLCLTNLIALWTVVMTGVMTSTFVAMSYVAAQLFSPPPYSLSVAAVGYLSTGPFLGGAIGFALVAKLTDPLIIWMSKKNNGVYEPEFRLLLVAFAFAATAGLFAYGTVAESQGDIYLIAFIWGLTLVGISFVIGPCSSYAIDAFRDMSNEVLVANAMFKNFLFFGYSYFINDWIADQGAADPFYIFGGISAALIISTVPVYMLGKRYRSVWYRYNIMEMFNVRPHAEV